MANETTESFEKRVLDSTGFALASIPRANGHADHVPGPIIARRGGVFVCVTNQASAWYSMHLDHERRLNVNRAPEDIEYIDFDWQLTDFRRFEYCHGSSRPGGTCERCGHRMLPSAAELARRVDLEVGGVE